MTSKEFRKTLCKLLSDINGRDFPCFCGDKPVDLLSWEGRDVRKAEKIFEILKTFGDDIRAAG